MTTKQGHHLFCLYNTAGYDGAIIESAARAQLLPATVIFGSRRDYSAINS
jgi:hypothetical protein